MNKLRLNTFSIVLLSILVFTQGAVQLYNDPAFLDAEIRRIRAGKAADKIPVQYHPSPKSYSTEDTAEEGAEGDDEESDYYSDEIDVTCATGKGWHHRGQRCVPFHCPGGPSARDFNTGECLHSFQPSGRYRPYSQWNSLKTHPAQKYISKGMLALLRRG